jgi:hypothetical protein
MEVSGAGSFIPAKQIAAVGLKKKWEKKPEAIKELVFL